MTETVQAMLNVDNIPLQDLETVADHFSNEIFTRPAAGSDAIPIDPVLLPRESDAQQKITPTDQTSNDDDDKFKRL